MSKLPYMQFYPADWLQDTQILSLEAQGAWMKLLCALWVAPDRGQIRWPESQLDIFWGLHRLDSNPIWEELCRSGVGEFDVSEEEENSQVKRYVTVKCRRMVKEERQRKQTLERVKRYRNAPVTDLKRRIYQKSEVRSHISEKSKRATQLPEDFTVSDEIQAWASEHRLPDPNGEIEAFRDYHQAKGSVFKSWDAALRTWLRNGKRFAGNGKPTPTLQTSQVPAYHPKPTERRADPAIRDGLRKLVSGLTEKMEGENG